MQALREGYARQGAADGRVLLAVSGGADSVALLVGTSEVATALHLAPEVACVDHGLRPESRAEGERVQALAARLGMRFHALEAHVAPGPGVEARAREARYQALERARAQGGLDWIATAHTASDQAETLLMRLVRGSSTAGARGIHSARGRVLRPMLGLTRRDVLAFLAERAVLFDEDGMNRDGRFLRVRVREGALPALAEAAGDPGGVQVQLALARFAAYAAEDEALLSRLAVDALRRLAVPGVPGGLDAAGVAALEPAVRRRVLARWLAEAGLSVAAQGLEGVCQALAGGRPVEVGRRRRAVCAGGVLRVAGGAGGGDTPLLEPPRLLAPGSPVEHRGSGQLVALDRSPLEAAASILPLDAAPEGPLELRTRCPGDRIRVGRQRRKLQDALVDLKVPRERRDQVALVAEKGGDVLWIVGFWPRRAGNARSGWYLSARALYDRQEPSKGWPRRL